MNSDQTTRLITGRPAQAGTGAAGVRVKRGLGPRPTRKVTASGLVFQENTTMIRALRRFWNDRDSLARAIMVAVCVVLVLAAVTAALAMR